ncbi:hypothetical protein Krac_3238 [Ktedonobacter racemifer DSM 44963]|uniref:Uncharacterized protein n=1 Tax=Ktedonobacter racemifer DSM 44963 TaxID=485913 RepID=D6U0T7_KTERA|nr:hypothetical protein Krac_3238 [Ktedonobacter racemifer DSM 44963]
MWVEKALPFSTHILLPQGSRSETRQCRPNACDKISLIKLLKELEVNFIFLYLER